MLWQEVRERYPHQWLLVEATDAYSEGGKRIVRELSVVNEFTDGTEAWKAYVDQHTRSRNREYLVLHTDREHIDISESLRLPIRPASCA